MISLNFTSFYKSLLAKRPNPKTFIYTGLGLVLALSLTGAIYFFQNYQKAQHQIKVLSSQTPTSPTDEATKILTSLDKLMVLPTDDKPTVATISDVTQLQNQTFFKKAQNGDHIIIYPTSQKVILYRSSQNKIIDITFINIQPSPSPKP